MTKSKILFLTIFLASLFVPMSAVFANDEVNIYFFWGNGCPHCEKERPFLESLESKYDGVKLNSYEVWENSKNRQFFIDVGKELNANISGVPFTLIGEKYLIGWYNEKTTGLAIENAVQDALENDHRDIGQEILSLRNQNNNNNSEKSIYPIPEKIKVPLLGEIETKNFSLPLLTIVLGALDGFNPCAMWALLFLISLLLGIKDKKRMWILGFAFIITSALVYFLFMAAWLNFLLFIGVIVWVRIMIGMVSLAGGGYSLKEYFFEPEITCKITDTKKKQKVFDRLKDIVKKKSFYLALGGIILLAFAVNLVELICSAGLPAVYTQVLIFSNLATWQYYFYLLLYIFIFMLDDLIIFSIAMATLRMTKITTKYGKLTRLVGGVLMIIMGLLLIFKPEWLMFG